MKLSVDKIREIALGAEEVIEKDGLVELRRFTREQTAALKTEEFIRKSYTPAGIRLQFKTDAVSLFLSVTSERGATRSYFAYDVLVDGKYVGSLNNFSDKEPEGDYTIQEFPLGVHSRSFALPEGEKQVTIICPWSVISKIKELSLDGESFVGAVKPAKKYISFGDSITHGYDIVHPKSRYAGRIADLLGAEEYCKAIGGEFFNPDLALAHEPIDPDYITVAYGTNDWSKKTKEYFTENCKKFYEIISKKFPNAKIFAITPIWRADINDEGKGFGDFSFVDSYVKEVTRSLENVVCITGIDLVPHDRSLFADNYLHPTDKGFDHYFENLKKAIEPYIS